MGTRNWKSAVAYLFFPGCWRDKVLLVFRLNGYIYKKEDLSQGKQEFPAQAKWYRRKVSKFFSLGFYP